MIARRGIHNHTKLETSRNDLVLHSLNLALLCCLGHCNSGVRLGPRVMLELGRITGVAQGARQAFGAAVLDGQL